MKNLIKNSKKLPEKLFCEVSVRSLGDVSLFDSNDMATSENVAQFCASKVDVQATVTRLKQLGFEIAETNEVSISIAGPVSLYQKVFGVTIQEEERLVAQAQDGTPPQYATCFGISNGKELTDFISAENTELAELIEGISINQPAILFANPMPPTTDYYHKGVPGDVSLALNADRAHRMGYTGRGSKVVMVDSGWYRHSYFTRRGYRVLPTVLGLGATNPTRDDNSHGTAESANVFATAPDATLQMVKMASGGAIAAFKKAMNLRPHIISCSWGYDIRGRNQYNASLRILSANVALAVRKGIIVIFSAGNGQFGFPGQHPDVISAGGVYQNSNGGLTASNYSSGFNSPLFRGRRIPDVSGLVGQRPRAQYIMLPVQPGSQLDRGLSGGNHPNGDETAANDGWAALSGTSAAAPQLAGICAQMRQANPELSPRMAKAVLMRTAVDVRNGRNAHNQVARVGYDLATGAGLADAYRAVLLARIVTAMNRVTTNSDVNLLENLPTELETNTVQVTNDEVIEQQQTDSEMEQEIAALETFTYELNGAG